jgi:RNA polymerase sigma-70 factor (ECF subfamily)
MLVRVARQRMRNDSWAEDAVSETIIAALEKPASFAGRAMLRSWLVGILKHKLVDQVRRHTRECQGEDDDESFDGPAEAELFANAGWGDPQEHLSRRQFMAQFDACVKTLPKQQERAIVMRDWLGADTEDICDELGVSSNHLAVMLHRARHRLRTSLQAHWQPMVAAPAQLQA